MATAPNNPHPFPTSNAGAAKPGDLAARPEAGSPAAAANAPGEDLLERVVQGAHAGIDRLAETAAPHLQRLQEGVSAAGDTLRAKTDEAREVGDEWAESLRCTVRENPLTALLAAAALGVLLARLSR